MNSRARTVLGASSFQASAHSYDRRVDATHSIDQRSNPAPLHNGIDVQADARMRLLDVSAASIQLKQGQLQRRREPKLRKRGIGKCFGTCGKSQVQSTSQENPQPNAQTNSQPNVQPKAQPSPHQRSPKISPKSSPKTSKHSSQHGSQHGSEHGSEHGSQRGSQRGSQHGSQHGSQRGSRQASVHNSKPVSGQSSRQSSRSSDEEHNPFKGYQLQLHRNPRPPTPPFPPPIRAKSAPAGSTTSSLESALLKVPIDATHSGSKSGSGSASASKQSKSRPSRQDPDASYRDQTGSGFVTGSSPPRLDTGSRSHSTTDLIAAGHSKDPTANQMLMDMYKAALERGEQRTPGSFFPPPLSPRPQPRPPSRTSSKRSGSSSSSSSSGSGHG